MSALPLRIAISKNIPSYMVSLTDVYSLTKKNIYAFKEYKYFKKMFKRLKNKKMKLLIAKKQLEKRFKAEIAVDMIYTSKSAYLGYDAKKRVIKKSKNIKIILAPHCFFDSPHSLGKNLHEDPKIPNYGKRQSGEKLVEGMAICIEPMVTMGDYSLRKPDDGYGYATRDNSLSAHFEHTIAITEKGPRILTEL